jgi:formylglycine-generating enzyme
VPAPGSGRNPNNADDQGWQAEWPLLERARLQDYLRTCGSDVAPETWTDSVEDSEALPINCTDWYVSFAFCIWEGGRLPTEAEWNYAAAGGVEQRLYAWGDSVEPYDNPVGADAGLSSHRRIGLYAAGASSPSLDGRFGQADLSGNLWELTRDWLGDYPLPCHDCSVLAEGPSEFIAIRGGGNVWNAEPSKTTERSVITRNSPQADIGFRCAYDL